VKVVWTLEATNDRHAIYSYIEAENPHAAFTLDNLISEKITYLINHPSIGRTGRVNKTRELIVHSNYVLIYDIADNLIRILRVLHASQQWPKLKGDLYKR
jgi:addiction module RelE/StbE family toxin